MPAPAIHSPRFLSLPRGDDVPPAAEIAAGLLADAAQLSPKWLYDPLGCALFVAITELDEYYPTRTEAAVMAAHQADIVQAVRGRLPGPHALVDLGAGNSAKAERLLKPLQPSHYVAVDIAEPFLRESLGALQQRHPALPMTGVALDFSQRLALPASVVDGPALVFYPGSSIGNFAPAQALALLQQARQVAGGGALLIGADLVKPARVLEAAYDDALGVTAAFNLNALRHVNRLLGSDFEPTGWRHVALYNEAESRVEMHLEARRACEVRWPGQARVFRAGERIHTENSYKWTPESFSALLHQAGWSDVRCWSDPQRWFGVFLASG